MQFDERWYCDKVPLFTIYDYGIIIMAWMRYGVFVLCCDAENHNKEQETRHWKIRKISDKLGENSLKNQYIF